MKKINPNNITIVPPLLPDVTVATRHVINKKKYKTLYIKFLEVCAKPININPAGTEIEQNMIYETVKP